MAKRPYNLNGGSTVRHAKQFDPNRDRFFLNELGKKKKEKMQLQNENPSRLQLSLSSDVLILLQDPLLPSLHRLPTDPTHLRMVEACAVRLKDLVGEASGSFKKSCNQFAQRIIFYVTEAHAHPRFSSYAPLHSSIDDIFRHAKVLLDLTVTVKHPEPQSWLLRRRRRRLQMQTEYEGAAAAAAAELGLGQGPTPRPRPIPSPSPRKAKTTRGD